MTSASNATGNVACRNDRYEVVEAETVACELAADLNRLHEVLCAAAEGLVRIHKHLFGEIPNFGGDQPQRDGVLGMVDELNARIDQVNGMVSILENLL